MVVKRLLPMLALAGLVACAQPRDTADTTRTDGSSVAEPVAGNANIVAGDPNTNTPAGPPPIVVNPNTAANGNTTNPNTTNPNTVDPNVANPNHLVNFGKPEPMVVMDANAKQGFDPSQVYVEADNGYPACENPPQVDLGYKQVAGCDAVVGTKLPVQSYCHMNYNFTVNWYQTNPPASGDHWPQPSRLLGVNVTPVPREYYVHSMEHGAVVLAYNCPNGCDYEQRVLREVVASRAERTNKVIMTPDPRMPPNTFAAISWMWLYPFNAPDAAKLRCFIDQHHDHGRELLPL